MSSDEGPVATLMTGGGHDWTIDTIGKLDATTEIAVDRPSAQEIGS